MEASQPAGLLSTITLRPYQKQSLAFMLAVKTSTDPSLVGERPGEGHNAHRMRSVAWEAARAQRMFGDAPPTRSVRGGWLWCASGP